MRLSTLGLVSLIASAIAAPAFAQTASISGSATFITPAGFTSTVSAESVLPSGFIFNTDAAQLGTPATPAVPFIPGALGAPGTPAVPAGAILGSIFPPNAPNVQLGLQNAQVIVVPSYNVLGFSVATTSLSVGSAAEPTAITGGSSFTAAAASILSNAARAIFFDGVNANISGGAEVVDRSGANPVILYSSTNIDFISAIISAGAGVSGLD